MISSDFGVSSVAHSSGQTLDRFGRSHTKKKSDRSAYPTLS